MEINVGDYARAINYENKTIIGKIIEVPNHQTCLLATGNEDTSGQYAVDEIIKHSKDIIDLIEVGDYVNGREVTSFGYDHNDKVIYVNTISCLSFENDEIETVLTKEQFEANAYKIEKER